MLKKCVVCLSLGLVSCATSPEPMPVGMVENRGITGFASDQVVRVKLNFELSNKLSDFTGIELTVYKGRVLLTGVAASEQVKREAVRISKNVSGVKDVIDGMNIQGEDGFAEYARDAWMTAKLKANLYADQEIDAPAYVVRTFDKVIYVFGTAQTKEEVKRVVEHAYDITGVRKVVNLIEGGGPPQKR
ncbi:MAG: BON domain-containing protein [Proteobacteria bacterium]|nr:BON domain-containing protein [Pseudomonadota bacterium]